ncbi:MAG: glycosyltransferase family 4 protein [Acidobacteriota bacterium]
MPAESLKIAFLGARGVIGTYSGIETYYEEVGSRLAERGHEVTAYCRSYFTPDVASHRGIRVRRLPSLRSKHLETLSHSLLGTFDCLLRDFDIVQYHAIGSAPLSFVPRLVGHKTVVSVRGLDWQRAKWGWFARNSLRFGEWASARCPTATAVVSKTLQQHYQREHGRTPTMIPNAVVLGEPRPINVLAEHGLEQDGFLLFAGRISPEKGVHTLLEALRPLARHKKLVVAGGTSYSDDYIRRIEAAAWDEVVFLGRVGREVMEELYSACYAFILPSVMEGLSIALLESLSYGNCIVTTDIPENLEVVGSAGLVFPPDDVAALRAALAKILDDPAVVEDYRRRALERARSQPDWDEVARLTEAFYLRLHRGEPPTNPQQQ